MHASDLDPPPHISEMTCMLKEHGVGVTLDWPKQDAMEAWEVRELSVMRCE